MAAITEVVQVSRRTAARVEACVACALSGTCGNYSLIANESGLASSIITTYLHCIYMQNTNERGIRNMKTRLQKWGNSLAVRIPKPFVKEAGLEYGAAVDVSVEEGTIVITPSRENEHSLEELLEGVNGRNIHDETETGPAAGREAW